MLFTSTMPTPTHAEKNRGRRVLFPLKRANTAAFGLCDRAAGLDPSSSQKAKSQKAKKPKATTECRYLLLAAGLSAISSPISGVRWRTSHMAQGCLSY
jgi:hypothetical protein